MNKYKRYFLSNKVPLYLVPVEGAKTTTILVMVKTGSRYETRQTSGLSHFLEHMFFKGTESRPDTLALSSELDALGGEYNAFTAKEYTGYWMKVAEDKVGPAFDVLADMLLHSKFDAEEIEREKGVIIEELKMYEDNPLMRIEDVFESTLYGDNSAGWETIGTRENIRSFSRQALLKYWRTQYGSRSICAVLAGGIKEKDKRLAIKHLEAFQANPWQPRHLSVKQQTAPRIRAAWKQADQLTMSLGVRTVPLGHKLEIPLKLLSIILGGAMSSRLFIRLRERSGLAYYVRTNTEAYPHSGYLTTQAGVPKEKAKAAVRIILEEYKRLKDEPVGQEELSRAKDLLRGRLLIQMEGSDSLATWYGRQAVMRKRLMTPGEWIKAIDKVGAKDIMAAARQVFQDKNLNLALIGQIKAEGFKPQLRF